MLVDLNIRLTNQPWITLMIRSKQIIRKWLPLAVVPMISMAVLSGCDSDDDDDSAPITNSTIVGDENGNGITDAVEVTTTLGVDTDGDNIDDRFDADETGGVDQAGGADGLANGIDDSFEVSVTGGDDVNMDGLDDACLLYTSDAADE